MFEFEFTKRFKQDYKKLSKIIQKKVDKQLQFLQKNISHPSLRTKRMQGVDRWEARVDRSYRLTFEKSEVMIVLRTVGPHDEALGRK